MTEKLYHEQTGFYLRKRVAISSDLVATQLGDIANDVENLAAITEQILANQDNYSPRYLPDPRNEQIPMGQPYVFFNKKTLGNLPPDVMTELYKVSNIADAMVGMTKKDYSDKISDVTLVSEKGYVISMDYNPDKPFITMSADYMDNLDYHTQSTWYNAVRGGSKVFFLQSAQGLA